MNISTVIGKKIEQTQAFLEDGKRVPLTRISVGQNSISQVKTIEKDGYAAVQLAIGIRNKISKPLTGHIKKAGVKNNPSLLREIRVDDVEGMEPGMVMNSVEMLSPGDRIDVVGISKGKGFAGGVKRWGFKGGPKTHGQSDRHRAPGSIGQGTTPGRVYKGKKMAGNMGNDRVTIKNLEVIEVTDTEIIIKGLVPGPKGAIITLNKIGVNKNFKPLYVIPSDAPEEEVVEEIVAEPVVEQEETASEVVESTNEQPEEVKEDTSKEVAAEREKKEDQEVKS